MGRLYYNASTMICVPTSQAQVGKEALGAQAGEASTTLDLVLKQVLNLSYAGNSRAFKAMNKLHAEFAPKPTEWVGGMLLIPEQLTMEEWDARYGPKDQSPAQKKSDDSG